MTRLSWCGQGQKQPQNPEEITERQKAIADLIEAHLKPEKVETLAELRAEAKARLTERENILIRELEKDLREFKRGRELNPRASDIETSFLSFFKELSLFYQLHKLQKKDTRWIEQKVNALLEGILQWRDLKFRTGKSSLGSVALSCGGLTNNNNGTMSLMILL